MNQFLFLHLYFHNENNIAIQSVSMGVHRVDLPGERGSALSQGKVCEGRGRRENVAGLDKCNAQIKSNYLNLASEQRIMEGHQRRSQLER